MVFGLFGDVVLRESSAVEGNMFRERGDVLYRQFTVFA